MCLRFEWDFFGVGPGGRGAGWGGILNSDSDFKQRQQKLCAHR